MNVREQIINYLLQNVDQKEAVIVELQNKIAELEKAAQATQTETVKSA